MHKCQSNWNYSGDTMGDQRLHITTHDMSCYEGQREFMKTDTRSYLEASN